VGRVARSIAIALRRRRSIFQHGHALLGKPLIVTANRFVRYGWKTDVTYVLVLDDAGVLGRHQNDMPPHSSSRFRLPLSSKVDLARRADLYRRLAAATPDPGKSKALSELALGYQTDSDTLPGD
jgi:hypothetical protein